MNTRKLYVRTSSTVLTMLLMAVWVLLIQNRLTELQCKLDKQTAVMAKVKQPITVNVYPEVVQRYQGLPDFEDYKK